MPDEKLILITRPEKEAEALRKLLEKRGIQAISEPLFSVQLLQENAPLLANALAITPKAVLVTSRHAIDALAAMQGRRDVVVITVGKASSDYARKRGFALVEYANGNALSLLEYVMQHYAKSERLLYVRGEIISLDIVKKLQAKGFLAEEASVYKTQEANTLSGEVQNTIRQDNISAVTFFSEHTAEIYNRLVQKHGLAQHHHTMTALCISHKVAAKATTLGWSRIIIADTATQAAMLEAIYNFSNGSTSRV